MKLSWEGTFEKCKNSCKKKADLFFVKHVAEYDASITEITQLNFHYKDRFNNVFTAILLNESFIKLFSQLNNISLQVWFLCSCHQTSQLHTHSSEPRRNV